jgi:hypothetical protein
MFAKKSMTQKTKIELEILNETGEDKKRNSRKSTNQSLQCGNRNFLIFQNF